MNTQINILASIFNQNENKTFITCATTEKKVTYGEIKNLSLELAVLLSQQSIKKNDNIGILSSNCIDYIIFYFSCMHLGTIAVPLNHNLHLKEIMYIITEAKLTTLLLSAEYENYQNELQTIVENIIIFKPKDPQKNLINTLKTLPVKCPNKNIEPFSAICDKDIWAIMFTSGTTGKPKGVLISYKSVISNGLTFVKALELSPDLIFYAILDLAYLGGLYNLMFVPFLSQAQIVLDKTFNPQTAIHFWNTTEKFHVNALWLVPSIASILLLTDRAEKGALYCKKNIKKVLIGTAPLPTELKKNFEKKYSVTLYENYGLSETLFISTNKPSLNETRGVGKLLPECKIIIRDTLNNQCENNKEGEIEILSCYGLDGYHKKQEPEADNCFKTGDIGYIDQDGYLVITDRKKDIIIRGGINISPREIEETIMQYDKVQEVAVVGIEHNYLGEEIVAAIKTNETLTEKEIKSFCAQHLAAYKIPSKILFNPDFPRSVTGKIQKNVLKKQIREAV